VSATLSIQQLGEIRVRDGAVQIFRDTYGGEWVGTKEGRLHGQHAIMDRRRLLAHLDTLAALDVVAEDIVAMPMTITPTLRECGWVMEAPSMPTHTPGQPSAAQYMCFRTGTADLQWTEDPRKALRFAREDDVRAFMRLTPLAQLLTSPKFFEWVTPC
jgi:hypothetical protein